MEIKSFDYDTQHGFAWIMVDTSNDDGEWIIQCCLADRNDEAARKGEDFEAKINCDDCGHDWGLCLDANKNAFEYWGENRCMKALFQAAKNAGIEVVGF